MNINTLKKTKIKIKTFITLLIILNNKLKQSKMAAFFEQKIRTMFTRFDIDKNGMIEVDDFQKWAATLAQIGQLNAERSAALATSLLAVWNVFFLPADTNKDGSVEVPELITHMTAVSLFSFMLL